METRKLPKDFEKNKLNLVLSNSELDILEDVLIHLLDKPLRNYLLVKIKKARIR